MQLDFDTQIQELESILEETYRKLEEKDALYETILEENRNLNQEITAFRNDLKVVEKERNELAEQLNNQQEPQILIDESDDDLFDFDEEAIEEFVEFDNKPTRN